MSTSLPVDTFYENLAGGDKRDRGLENDRVSVRNRERERMINEVSRKERDLWLVHQQQERA